MRRLLILSLVLGLLPAGLCAPSPVSLSVDTRSRGFAIPEDFAGISFETYAEGPDRSGVSGYFFSPTNAPLITLFTNSGIHTLRLGGCTVEGLEATVPSRADIDNVFGFARAARLRVIYSLRLLNGEPAEAASTAQYVWTHYRDCLTCFSIGNEPNEPPYSVAPVGAITNYAGYLAAWRTFADAVGRAVPGARFAGPDAGGWGWSAEFARDEKASGRVVLITHHEYAGGKPFRKGGHEELSAAEAIDNMLAGGWATNEYARFYHKTLALVATNGLRCRMTEANDYLRGVTHASDAFASALWALDYLHWWAAHGCAGVDFHNNQHKGWLKTDTVFWDAASREYRINPKAYAFRAFDLGSHGWTVPVVAGNAEGVNLAAYAVSDHTNLWVTLINKEHGAGARGAAVTIGLDGGSIRGAEVMFLSAANGEAGATNGITFGGQPIRKDAPWQGRWTTLTPAAGHVCEVVVPAVSAAVVKVSLKESPAWLRSSVAPPRQGADKAARKPAGSGGAVGGQEATRLDAATTGAS